MEVYSKLEIYHAACVGGGERLNENSILELKDRVWQIEYAAERISQITTELDQLDLNPLPGLEDLKHTNDLAFNEMKFYVETYYYFAHRIIKLINSSKFPRLDRIGNSEINIVRNHLIEHPEGKNANATDYHYTYSKDTGLRLRSSYNPLQGFTDEGFVLNRSRFEEKLLKNFDSAFKSIQANYLGKNRA